MGDGHLNKCKCCAKSDSSKAYMEKSGDEEYKEKERSRSREKYRRLYVGTGKSDVKRNRKYLNRYPEKEAAKNYSSNLIAPFDKAERHHWSYSEDHFKDVIWLLKKEHMKSHRFIVYDQERKMYRRFDTNELLHTKEKHHLFILDCIKNKED